LYSNNKLLYYKVEKSRDMSTNHMSYGAKIFYQYNIT